MIDDMASLKQTMEQMDANDFAVAQAAKERAAQMLSDAELSFSKMADLIEQHRLLLSPKIVDRIKRMDQPDILGNAAFHETSTSLRDEGQSFREIAEALELNGGAAPRFEAPAQRGELPHRTGELPQPIQMESEPAAPAWLLYPLQHPVRLLVIGLVAFMLFNTVRGFVGLGRQGLGHLADIGASHQHADGTSSGSSSATPSGGPATASNPPASASAPTATAPAPATNDGAPHTRLGAKSPSPLNSATNDHSRMAPRRGVEDRVPVGLRRDSQLAGPCIGGTGGCYWGGDRY